MPGDFLVEEWHGLQLMTKDPAELEDLLCPDGIVDLVRLLVFSAPSSFCDSQRVSRSTLKHCNS